MNNKRVKLTDIVKVNAEKKKDKIHALFFDNSKNKKFIIVYKKKDSFGNTKYTCYDIDNKINLIIMQGVTIDEAIKNVILYHSKSYTEYEGRPNEKLNSILHNKYGLDLKDTSMRINILNPISHKISYMLLGWRLEEI